MEKEELQQIISATAQAVAAPLLSRIQQLESESEARKKAEAVKRGEIFTDSLGNEISQDEWAAEIRTALIKSRHVAPRTPEEKKLWRKIHGTDFNGFQDLAK